MATPTPPTLLPIVGAGLLGILFAAPLFGVYTVQVYHYFLKYPKDPFGFKGLVYFLWIVLGTQYAINIHSIYAYLIKDFGHPDRLGRADGDFLAYAVFDSVCAVMVQCFFAWRLHLIIKHPILKWFCVSLIVALSWLGLISGLYLYARGFQIEFFSKFRTLTWLSDLWLGSNVACDVIITICMCATLHTSRTGIKRTDLLINKLIAYSIRTGAVTSFVEIFCLATATTSGFHFGHIMVIFPLGPLYCISLLANLHARAPNSPQAKGGDVVSIRSTTINGFGSRGGPSSQKFVAPTASQVSGTEYELDSKIHSMPDDIEMNSGGF